MSEIHGYEHNETQKNHQGAQVTPGKSLQVNLTENTPENPQPVQDIDSSGRTSSNTFFGEKIVVIPEIMIATQFQYGIEDGTAVPDLGNGGSISIEGNLLVLHTGVNPAGFASIESFETVRYVPGTQVFAKFTTFSTGSKPLSVTRGGLYDLLNGFFLEIVDNKAYFVRRRIGIDFREEIDLDAFAEREGYTLNIDKGNIFTISFVYLGFGPILLEVERPDGRPVMLHKIEYPNKFTETHIAQTYLPLRAEVFNEGNTTDVSISIGSISAGIMDGTTSDAAKRSFTYENDTVFPVIPETTLVAFRNKDEFNSIVNRIIARLILISGSNDVNKNCRWRLFKNPTFLNTPTWTDVNTNNSILEYSEDALVDFTTSEDVFLAWNTARLDNFFENVAALELDLPPNGTAAFAIETGLGGSGEADLSIRWDELF